jgi:hypothetical protein
MSQQQHTKATSVARFLEAILLLNLFLHAIAVLAMALLLLPGLPGGSADRVEDRAAYIAAHPWLWRLGWLPWQLTAVADLLLSFALIRTAWVPRRPAMFSLLATLAAVIPDLAGETLWVTRGVEIAHEAVRSGAAQPYADFEARMMWQVGAVAGSLYVVMALGWTWSFAAAGVWCRTLTWLSVASWTVLGASSLVLLLPESQRPPTLVLAVGNALGFLLLLAWLALVTGLVRRRMRTQPVHHSCETHAAQIP